MVMKCSVGCLVALVLLGSLCDAQYGKPIRNPIQKPAQPVRQEPSKQVPQQPEQSRQTFEKPLTWRYPEIPQPVTQPEVPFELRYPVPAATVAVECREQIAHVEVKKDLFGIGQFINPADLTLGTCPAAAEDTGAQVLIFESLLHDCGSSLAMTEHALIYTFFLKYAPQTLGGSPVVRTSPAAVIVECHYPRKHNVSSLPLDPFWIPFSAVKMAEEFLYFSLKLMTDDWQFERPRYEYFLGDLINIEAIVKQYNHVPLRVYVDHCVACLSLDASSPRYAFIENHGCLVDARITGSASKFMPRVAENKVQFQLEAFRFQGADSGLLYISCHLKATSTAYAFDSEHRACSYINGWKEASGADAACGSCESPDFGAPLQPGGINVPVGGYPGSSGSLATAAGGVGSGSTSGGYWGGTGSGGSSPLSHPSRKMRDVSQSEILEWEGDVTLGPISIGERVIA
ncbi:putative zona pellucida sperm-binding protein 3-like [Scophthalmus maximus]|uniref:Zona pellucida sperm-binding protein 3 n=1 Tax=Scophthalmus maximus TaxID=52904 RepID=A0A2U9BWD1_SCOMX|nr:putative zona pellucida sperm-binding protein 3-like [Scophthalmus maximus]